MTFSFVIPDGWTDEMSIAAGLLQAMCSSFDGELPVSWTLEEYAEHIKDCRAWHGQVESFDAFVAKHETELAKLNDQAE